MLQYISDDDDPAGMIRGYVDRLAAGSYVAMSHPSTDELTRSGPTARRRPRGVYQRTETPFHYRTKAEFEAFFAGLELVEPGVVHMWDWRPEFGSDADNMDGKVTGFAGVGRKG